VEEDVFGGADRLGAAGGRSQVLRINRTTGAFIIGASLMISFGMLAMNEAIRSFDRETLIFGKYINNEMIG
jgi:hypothetical protein